MNRAAPPLTVRLLPALLVMLPVLGCSGAPALPQERVETPAGWRTIPLGNLSFRFPGDVDLPGYDDMCGGRSAPRRGCAVGIEGPVFRYRSAGLTLMSRDDHGERGAPAGEYGERIRLNEGVVYRARLADGSLRYTVTAGSGGDEVATLLWYEPDVALLWLTCSNAQACGTAKAIAGSVRFAGARDFCRGLEAKRQAAAARGAQRPPPPPPPPVDSRCRRFL